MFGWPAKLREQGGEVFIHPAYGPDLPSSDNFLFHGLEKLRGNIHLVIKIRECKNCLHSFFPIESTEVLR